MGCGVPGLLVKKVLAKHWNFDILEPIKRMKSTKGLDMAEAKHTPELLDLCEEGIKGALAAWDEVANEFVSHRRAADWGIINDGLMAASKAKAAIAKAKETK